MINNHKIIGVCVTKVQYRAESIYLTRLNEAAVKMGYKLMIFNSVANSDNSFDAGAKSVYSVINHDIIDVLVILSSTFGVKEIEKAIIAKAHAHGTPVILIDSKEDGCYSIIKQYGKALKAVMNHIIRDHGVRDTFFLAGHRENDPTSDFRIQCYKEVLEENEIPFTDDMMDYGEYWSIPARKATEKLFTRGKDIPKAIICANDYMAVAVCEVLREHGLDVPKDVLVTGFGGAADAQYFNPRFTTCIEDMGKLAELTLQVAEDALEKHIPCGSYHYEMSPLISESCGCVSDINHVEDAGYLFHMMQDAKNHEGHVLSWLDRMVESEDMDAVCRMLSRCILSNSLLCLREKYVAPIGTPVSENTDVLTAVYHVDGDAPDKTEVFSADKMIPNLEEWLEDNTCCILTAVFVCQTVCGYYAVFTEDVKSISQNLNRESKVINIAFNSAINHRRQVLLLESVQNANIVNPITKLPNLKGANRWFDKFNANEDNHNKAIVVSIYGLPKYKFIYENYGMQDIEATLCYVAKALKEANPSNSFIGHISEDEFTVINYLDDSSMISDTVNNATKSFFNSIEKYNASSGLEYYVEVNCGCITADPGWEGTFANFTKRATGEMYINRVKSGMTAVVKEHITPKEHYDKFNTLIDQNLFNYNFQPIVSAKNGEIIAYEALMRTAPSIGMNPMEVLETAGEY
ncbi:MAG: substrate-binding domain-containing protein, partial [Oscillospiraceae bacterium]|nr:substrate-binding domain-containing protein [Oscillospiraceae bacterium]